MEWDWRILFFPVLLSLSVKWIQVGTINKFDANLHIILEQINWAAHDWIPWGEYCLRFSWLIERIHQNSMIFIRMEQQSL